MVSPLQLLSDPPHLPSPPFFLFRKWTIELTRFHCTVSCPCHGLCSESLFHPHPRHGLCSDPSSIPDPHHGLYSESLLQFPIPGKQEFVFSHQFSFLEIHSRGIMVESLLCLNHQHMPLCPAFLMWVWGIELMPSYLQGKHFTCLVVLFFWGWISLCSPG